MEDIEKITYHFQPNQQFDAIKCAIIKRFNLKKMKQRDLEPSIKEVDFTSYEHVGGLPSPPVEEKKISIDLVTTSSSIEPTLSSNELKEKIQLLRQEKHKLFQLMKQMMVQEELKKKQQQQQLQQRQQQQRQLQQQQQQPERKRMKKKSRWSPATPGMPTYNNNTSYFYR